MRSIELPAPAQPSFSPTCIQIPRHPVTGRGLFRQEASSTEIQGQWMVAPTDQAEPFWIGGLSLFRSSNRLFGPRREADLRRMRPA